MRYLSVGKDAAMSESPASSMLHQSVAVMQTGSVQFFSNKLLERVLRFESRSTLASVACRISM